MAKRVEMACRDCKRCTNAAIAEGGRKLGRAGALLATGGLSEVGFAMKKTCRLCGHQMSLHGGVNAPPPTVQVVPGQPAWVQPVAQPSPDGVDLARMYPFTPDVVFVALADAVAAVAKPQSQDPIGRSVSFGTKVSAMSWGANLTAVVELHESGSMLRITGAPKVVTQQGAAGAAVKHGNLILDRVGQNLAASGAPRVMPPSPSSAPATAGLSATHDDLLEQLGRLGELKATGVLTDDEFAAAKTRLLGSDAVSPVPALSAGSEPPAGWYADPDGSGQQRWWDGAVWTEHFHA